MFKSALIYSEANNSITFELRNSSGTVIDDTTLNVIAGQQRIDLNFDVPIGNDMQLGVATGALQTYGLYRNNAGASYPYDIASALNITSSSASTAPYSYYYFYYDIEVETPCQGTGTGTASWDCDGQGNCFDPGTGNGQYTSLNQCQSSCVSPTVSILHDQRSARPASYAPQQRSLERLPLGSLESSLCATQQQQQQQQQQQSRRPVHVALR